MANFSMPWVEADFRRKTQHLSRFQREAYRSLLQACWDGDGTLPDNDKLLAKICDIDIRAFRKHREALLAFFYRNGTGWRHQRIDADLARLADIHMKRSIAGQKGVVARVIKNARRH